jgi:hypothetical protein
MWSLVSWNLKLGEVFLELGDLVLGLNVLELACTSSAFYDYIWRIKFFFSSIYDGCIRLKKHNASPSTMKTFSFYHISCIISSG